MQIYLSVRILHTRQVCVRMMGLVRALRLSNPIFRSSSSIFRSLLFLTSSTLMASIDHLYACMRASSSLSPLPSCSSVLHMCSVVDYNQALDISNLFDCPEYLFNFWCHFACNAARPWHGVLGRLLYLLSCRPSWDSATKAMTRSFYMACLTRWQRNKRQWIVFGVRYFMLLCSCLLFSNGNWMQD